MSEFEWIEKATLKTPTQSTQPSRDATRGNPAESDIEDVWARSIQSAIAEYGPKTPWRQYRANTRSSAVPRGVL